MQPPGSLFAVTREQGFAHPGLGRVGRQPDAEEQPGKVAIQDLAAGPAVDPEQRAHAGAVHAGDAVTLADIGNAEIPAAPTIGLIFTFLNRFRNLAKSTPPMVSMTNATSPKAMIMRVWRFQNWSAVILTEMVSPRRIETRLTSSFCAELLSLSRTPHSLRRLPNIRNPTRGREAGAMNPATTMMMIGNRILVSFETLDAL